MELWIRSQKNRRITTLLLKVSCLELREADTCNIVANGLYFVGKYKTKERALEVLDEIQSKINDILNYDHIEDKVYEMPLE